MTILLIVGVVAAASIILAVIDIKRREKRWTD
jgi:preprotein translocase subunit SecE